MSSDGISHAESPRLGVSAAAEPRAPRALTIDLEDWHQTLHHRVTGRWIRPSPEIVTATLRVLDFLDEHGVCATFFVLGTLAESLPSLVREVARRGHEIGSHSYSHDPVFAQTPARFRADVLRSKQALEDLLGREVRGFRAPNCSVGGRDHFCFDVLAELGFLFDSSVVPARHGRHHASPPLRPFQIQTRSGPIREFPLATWQPLPAAPGATLLVAGGTLYRVLPTALVTHAIDALEAGGVPIVLYLHPYELYRTIRTLHEDVSLRERLAPIHVACSIAHNLGTPRIARTLGRLLRTGTYRPLGALCQ